MPWRNGQGTTLEIAREPGNGPDFAWRLSLAKLERSCNFSSYPGYRRALVLVCGEDLRLTFWRHGSRLLASRGHSVRFDGSWRTRCAVPARCTDLSLIVRDGSGTGRSIVRAPRLLRVNSNRRLLVPRGLYTALMPLCGTVAVANSAGSRPRLLRPLDTLLLSPARRQTWSIRRVEGRRAALVLLQWCPGRRSPAHRHDNRN
jgi:environmental stress-induced protein Ves